jgi:hypothetical protein
VPGTQNKTSSKLPLGTRGRGGLNLQLSLSIPPMPLLSILNLVKIYQTDEGMFGKTT